MQSDTKSVLGVEVSIWPNYFTSDAPKTVNLLTWLTSGKYRARVEQIRALPGKSDRDALKATLPAITVSGLFTERRAKNNLARHSGLIALDFDQKDNRHIQNFTDLRAQLCQIPSVAYCGLSVSGTGFFAVIPIVHPERHEHQFDALKRIFWQRWRLVADASCRDVSRLRGYSFDSDGFFRHDALPFRLFDEPAPAAPRTFAFTNDADKTRREVEDCISQVVKRGIDLAPAYSEWFALGQSLASAFGESGREYYQHLSQFNEKYDAATTDRKYTECVKTCSRFSIATFFDYCKRVGIKSVVRQSGRERSTHHTINEGSMTAIAATDTRPRLILDGRTIYGELLTVSPCTD